MSLMSNYFFSNLNWHFGKDESRSQFSKEFAELRELKTLLDDKIITQEEFEAKKKQLLDL